MHDLKQLEKEIDETLTPGYAAAGEKRQDLYQQLLALHSDVTNIGKGVEEVEDRAKKMMDGGEKPSSFSIVSSIIDTHFDTLTWISHTTEDLNNKLSNLEGLS